MRPRCFIQKKCQDQESNSRTLAWQPLALALSVTKITCYVGHFGRIVSKQLSAALVCPVRLKGRARLRRALCFTHSNFRAEGNSIWNEADIPPQETLWCHINSWVSPLGPKGCIKDLSIRQRDISHLLPYIYGQESSSALSISKVKLQKYLHISTWAHLIAVTMSCSRPSLPLSQLTTMLKTEHWGNNNRA